MNPFDANILHFLNQFAQRSEFFNKSVVLISGNVLFNGGAIMALFWWGWFRNRETAARDREFILSGIVMSTAALFAARALALTLPFRLRPRYDPALHFVTPTGTYGVDMIHWSAFPSDHAVMYFSLATCLFFISRKVGIFAYCHAFFIVCLPRIYMGVHFPTDALGGALLGIGIASLSLIKGLREFISRPPLRWIENEPGYAYPCLYLSTLLIGMEFDPVRALIASAWKVITGSAQGMH